MKKIKTEHVYKSLKEFREDTGRSQGKLAEELGYGRVYITQIERGHAAVTGPFRKRFHEAFGHMGYKVKDINDLMGPVKREVPDSKNSQVVIEKLKEQEKNSQGWRGKDARPAIEPKVTLAEATVQKERKPWVDEAVQEANGKAEEEAVKWEEVGDVDELKKKAEKELAKLTAPKIIVENFNKVYLVISDGGTKGFKTKEKAAVFAWDLAIEGIVYRVDEVEVE